MVGSGKSASSGQEQPEPSRDWQSLIEERIQQLDLDNLPNKGKRLDLRPNPYADPSDDATQRLLKNAGYTLPWIADGRRIDADLEKARSQLQRARDEYEELPDTQICAGHQWVEGQWQAAIREFRSQIEQINRQIRDHNLEVTLPMLQKLPIRVDEELARLGVTD